MSTLLRNQNSCVHISTVGVAIQNLKLPRRGHETPSRTHPTQYHPNHSPYLYSDFNLIVIGSGSRSCCSGIMAAIAASLKPPELITSLSIFYQLFFLYIEPISTIVGAYYAYFLPSTYLELTHPSVVLTTDAAITHPAAMRFQHVPTATTVVLAQLANLYLLFAINEGLVLRCTRDVRVWRTLLLGLLVADLGHLYACKELGIQIYWKAWEWNAMGMGNIGFVYLGALMRVCFLCGVGVATSQSGADERRLRKKIE